MKNILYTLLIAGLTSVIISCGSSDGSSGSSGSTDATGSNARFTGLEGITNDGTSLFLTDVNNHTIRKID